MGRHSRTNDIHVGLWWQLGLPFSCSFDFLNWYEKYTFWRIFFKCHCQTFPVSLIEAYHWLPSPICPLVRLFVFQIPKVFCVLRWLRQLHLLRLRVNFQTDLSQKPSSSIPMGNEPPSSPLQSVFFPPPFSGDFLKFPKTAIPWRYNHDGTAGKLFNYAARVQNELSSVKRQKKMAAKV